MQTRPVHPTVWNHDLTSRKHPAHFLPPPWRRRLMKTGRRSRQIIARDQPRDFPESLRQHLCRGRREGLGRWGGWGLVRYLAAPEATPQIGSDGEELARRRYLYGFPPVLEWGNGRCVVTGEISPGNRPSACQVGLALRSDNSKGSEYRGGMNITESFVGSGGLAVTGEPRRRCAVIYAFPSQFPSGFRGTTGRKGGGWGEQREPCARARAWESGSRPTDRAAFRALAQICLFSPSPIFPQPGPVRVADGKLAPAHARFLFFPFPAYGSSGGRRCNLCSLLIGWNRHLSCRPERLGQNN